ncbi:hypothetical protein GCM10027258_62330 [Amycolatopsis stemonae]
MTAPGIDYAIYQNALMSHAQASGLFEKVNGHEIIDAPGQGVHAEVFTDTIDPASSGMAATSVRLAVRVRITTDMHGDPQDGIDPRIVQAAGAFMGSVHADFEVDGNARFVDLLGAHGVPLSARSGYITKGGQQYRAMDVVVPIILNDVWDQEA